MIYAAISLTTVTSLLILDVDMQEERVKTVITDGDNMTRAVWCKIHYNQTGSPYFIKCGHRYYLEDMMRVQEVEE